MTELRIIKKYPNRRLYDTTKGTYITLDDVKQLVFNHVDFKVIDTHTQKDLTQSTLMQIITELEANTTPLFTINVLQDFIRFYQEKSQNMLSQYLEQSFNMFSKQKDFFSTQWTAYQALLSNPAIVKQAIKMQKILMAQKETRLKTKKKESNK